MKTRISFFLVNGLFIVLAACFSTLLLLAQINDEARMIAKQEQEEAIQTFWLLLREKGSDFRIVDGRLMAGSYVINGNSEIPDKVTAIFGGTAAVFMGDIRVSSNVQEADGSRAVGTRLQGPAFDAIFTEHTPYRGETEVLGTPFFTAYDPIHDATGKTIGVLHVGVKRGDFLTSFTRLQSNIIVGTTIISLLFLALAFGFLLQRRSHENALWENERRYLALINTMLNGIALFEIIRGSDGRCCDLRYLSVNDAHELHTGLTREQVLGKTLREIFPNEEDNWLKLIRNLPEQSTPQQFEFYSPSLGKWFEMAVYAPQERQVALIFSDISQRHAVNDKIRRVARVLSESSGATFFSSLVENLAALLQAECVFIGELVGDDKDRIQVIASYSHGKPAGPTSYAIAGTPCAEVVQGSFCFYPEGVARRFPGNRLLDDLNAEGFAGIPLRLADGRVVGVLVVLDSKPLQRQEDSDSICQLFATRAATELNRLQDEIRQQQLADKIRLIIDSVPASIAYVDAESRYRFANHNYVELYGFTQEQIIGLPVMELLGEHSSTTMRENFQHALSGTTVTFLNQKSSSNAQDIFLQTTYIPHCGQQGEVLGFFVQHIDITERRKLEDSLGAQVTFLQTLIDAIPNPIFYKDRAGRYLGYNRSFESYLGFSREQLIGKTVYDIAPQELADTYHHMDEALFVNPGTQVYESSVIYADGSHHDVVFNKATFTDGAGLIGGLVGVILDVTYLKQTEEALRQAQVNQQAVLDNIPDLVWLKDPESRFIIANKAFADAVSSTPDKLVGKSDFDLFPADLAAAYRGDDLEIITSGRQKCIEEHFEGHDGVRIWIETIKRPVYSAKGILSGTTGIARNIHQRKQTEKALRESEECFHQIFSQSDDAIVLFRMDTFAIIDANPAAQELFGYDRSDLLTRLPHALIAQDDFRQLLVGIGNSTEAHYFQLDKAVGIRKDTTTMQIIIRARILHLRAEYVVHCSIRDITEKLKLEEEIRATQAKLIQTNKMTSLGMLSSSVAHEINNPNNCISVNASMLTEVWQDTEPILTRFHTENGEFNLRGVPYSQMQEIIPRLFHGITEGSRRITAIVDNMRDFVRENKNGRHAELDVNKLIRNAASILWHHIHKFTDNFQMVLPDDIPPAQGNGQQIEQVIINLLMNALQSLPDKQCGVCITTSSDPASGEIVVTVRDEGTGMSSHAVEHLREPFFTTKLDKGGTGLGLYISDSIIKEHRGSLEFSSHPGQGTVATIHLPAA